MTAKGRAEPKLGTKPAPTPETNWPRRTAPSEMQKRPPAVWGVGLKWCSGTSRDLTTLKHQI
jgi:hypothetical protein